MCGAEQRFRFNGYKHDPVERGSVVAGPSLPRVCTDCSASSAPHMHQECATCGYEMTGLPIEALLVPPSPPRSFVLSRVGCLIQLVLSVLMLIAYLRAVGLL